MSPQNPDAVVAQKAAVQYGNVTHRQLIDAGLTDTAIGWRVRRGRLYRVHAQVYAVGHPPRLPLERAAAAVLACGPGAALSHFGALALWGFSKQWPDAFDVIVPTGDRRPDGITTHRYTGLIRRDLTVQLGIRATSPARTVLDCLPDLGDRQRTRTVNDALHGPFLKRSQLADVRARFPTHRGAALLDPFLDGGNPTRSPFEDDFVAFCEHHHLPRPQINARVAGHIVDALFEDHKLIVELDSWEFHGDRQAFETDRARDADTLEAGYRTLRLTWERRPRRETRRRRGCAGCSAERPGRRAAVDSHASSVTVDAELMSAPGRPLSGGRRPRGARRDGTRRRSPTHMAAAGSHGGTPRAGPRPACGTWQPGLGGWCDLHPEAQPPSLRAGCARCGWWGRGLSS